MFQARLRGVSMLLVCLLLAGMAPLAVRAQDGAEATPGQGQSAAPVQIILRPDGKLDGERLEVEAKPGKEQTLKIFIGNVGSEPLAVFTYTADIRTKVNGGMAIGAEGSELHEPTTWIDYPTEYYDIDPGKEIEREFPLTVPKETAPGQYVIPLAVETVDSFAVPGNDQIRQKIRKIIPIYVTVPGDFQAGFEFGDPAIEYLSNGVAVRVPITNTGQSTLRLVGTMVMKDSTGVTVLEDQIVMGAFYGLQETTVQSRLAAPLPPGEYLLSLELKDEVSGVANKFEDRPVTMPEAPSNEVTPLAFGNVLIAPNADPIQFASVLVEIVNNASTIRSARLTLIVNKDGKLLEEFVLADNVTLDQGTTTISQRYLPLTGWESGSYTFSLRLETVDPATGGTSLLLTGENVATIDV